MALSSYGTLKFWLDATQESYTEGAAMTTFTDRAGTNHFAGDGASLPLMNRTAMNGKPAAMFDATGNRRFDAIEPGRIPAACTIVFVLKFNAAVPTSSTSRFILDTDVDSQISRHYIQWLSTGAIQAGTDAGGGSVTLPASVIVANAPVVLSMTWNSASTELRLNLINVATGTVNSGSAGGNTTQIGAHRSGTPSIGPLHMSEVVCYTAPLSTENLRRVTGELMAKYNIQVPGVVVG